MPHTPGGIGNAYKQCNMPEGDAHMPRGILKGGHMRFFFAYYPYICITLLVAGLAFRYVTAPGGWNARFSELF